MTWLTEWIIRLIIANKTKIDRELLIQQMSLFGFRHVAMKEGEKAEVRPDIHIE